MHTPNAAQLQTRAEIAKTLLQMTEKLMDTDKLCCGFLCVTAGLLLDTPDRQMEFFLIIEDFIERGQNNGQQL